MSKYLDETGLAYFWSKIKQYFQSQPLSKYFGHNWNVDENDSYGIVVGNGASESSKSDAVKFDYDGSMFARARSSKPTRQGSAPDTNTAIHSFRNYDSNDESIGYSQIIKTITNNIYRSFAVQNEKDNGDEVTTALYLYANRDGSHSASMTDGTAWPIKNGGTNATNATDARTNLGLKALATKNSGTVNVGANVSYERYTKTYTIAANTQIEVDVNGTDKTNYISSGITRITSGSAGVTVMGWNLNSGVLKVYLRNITSSKISSKTLSVEIRHIQTSNLTRNVSFS